MRWLCTFLDDLLSFPLCLCHMLELWVWSAYANGRTSSSVWMPAEFWAACDPVSAVAKIGDSGSIPSCNVDCGTSESGEKEAGSMFACRRCRLLGELGVDVVGSCRLSLESTSPPETHPSIGSLFSFPPKRRHVYRRKDDIGGHCSGYCRDHSFRSSPAETRPSRKRRGYYCKVDFITDPSSRPCTRESFETWSNNESKGSGNLILKCRGSWRKSTGSSRPSATAQMARLRRNDAIRQCHRRRERNSL